MKTKSERVSADYLVDTLETLGIPQAELAKEIGLGGGTISKWVKDNKCPKWALLACEALMRRQRKKANSSTTLIVRVPNGKLEAFKQIADGLGFGLTEVGE